MARKFKKCYWKRVKTKVFGLSARFNLVQEPIVKAHKSPSSSKNGDQFTFSHPIVQTQTLSFNDKSSSCISRECIDNDKRHESGQGLNLNNDLDQGLNPASSDRRAESQIVQVNNSNIESSGVVPGSVSCSLEGQYDLEDVNQHYDTVQVGLGVNFAPEQNSPGANMVVGSSLVYPGKVNTPLRDCADITLDFIPIYDINHAGVEEKIANSIIHFNQFTDQPMDGNTDSYIFRKWSSLPLKWA